MARVRTCVEVQSSLLCSIGTHVFTAGLFFLGQNLFSHWAFSSSWAGTCFHIGPFLLHRLNRVDPGGSLKPLPAPQQFRIMHDYETGPCLISAGTTWRVDMLDRDRVDPGGSLKPLPVPQQFRIGPDIETSSGLISAGTTWRVNMLDRANMSAMMACSPAFVHVDIGSLVFSRPRVDIFDPQP